MGKSEVIGYVGFVCNDSKIFNLLSALFDNSPYISIKFDKKVIEIFNKTKDSKIRKENWDQVYKMLEEAL